MHETKPIANEQRARILASLFTPEEGSRRALEDAELGALLAHQMRSGILAALVEDAYESGQRLRQIEQTLAHHGITTFADLLDHPAPPEPLLSSVRRYTKRLVERVPEGFPPEVAQVIMVLCELRAPSSNAASARSAPPPIHLARWCLAQTWLDETTRERIRRGLP
ncbi:MAG: hypothetical protein EOM91_19520 [Sphingobacteriia bacterium]|nr:hypothetical protein [Sphingobacteriia bacterium]NCC40229.1 hypothetical protein [Gammaproteobacteria bacterium]